MATIASKGVGVAAIFDPYVSGTIKARLTGITVGTSKVDLNEFQAALIYGSAAPPTGIKSQGVDLNEIFAASGTAVYDIPGVQGKGYLVSAAASGVAGQPGASVNLALNFNSDGTYSFTGTVVSSGGGSGLIGGFPDSGTWKPSTWTAATTQIQFSYVVTILEVGGASIVNGASTYQYLTSTRSLTMSAACAATSPNGRGSKLDLTILLKNTTTGAVLTTTCTVSCDAIPGV